MSAPPRNRSLDRQIWALAGPALLTLAAEPLYLLADTAIVARLGTEQLGGLAVASAILLFASGMLIFLTFGTAAVAVSVGAGDPGEAAEQSVQGLWLGLGLGVLVGVGLAVASPWLLSLFGAEPAVIDEARTFLLISLLGMPAVTVALAGTGALRGHLDTRTPLAVAILANTINVLLELWLVFVLDWDVAGSAASTVVAKWVAAGVYTVIVLRLVRRSDVSTRPDRTRIIRLAVIGRDLFIRTVALRGALTLTVALAARKGTTALAAYQVAFMWWGLLAYLLDALEAAAQSLVARALGSADTVLAQVTSRRILCWALGAGSLVGVATVVLRGTIASVFIDNSDVVALLSASLVWVGLTQPVNALAFALDGILVGAGDQRFLAIAMVGSFLVLSVGAVIVASPSVGLGGIWALLTIFMATRVLALGWRYRGTTWLRVGATL